MYNCRKETILENVDFCLKKRDFTFLNFEFELIENGNCRHVLKINTRSLQRPYHDHESYSRLGFWLFRKCSF